MERVTPLDLGFPWAALQPLPEGTQVFSDGQVSLGPGAIRPGWVEGLSPAGVEFYRTLR